MVFPTASDTSRPVRLSEQTRAFALESMHGKYGDEAVAADAVSMDDIDGFSDLPRREQYDRMISRIAKTAPLRFCDGERIVGAATLGSAIGHMVPAKVGGTATIASVSHLTIDYEEVLRFGLVRKEQRIAERRLTADEAENRYLDSLQNAIDAFRHWHGRYLAGAKEKNPAAYELLKQVPFSPARSFYEAVQSLWMTFAFVRLCGNWPGIGRIDRLLGEFLANDLRDGVLTIEEAREILASFFIKGCEWIRSDTPCGSGDAQHYQNIVLSGVDENGELIENEVTFLVLDVVEELAISDYPITVRISSNSSDRLIRRIAEVVRHGGGIVAVYSEDVVKNAMVRAGYPQDEVWKFANDGCWETQFPGETSFIYIPFDGLQYLQEKIAEHEELDDIEMLYSDFLDRLHGVVGGVFRDIVAEIDAAWACPADGDKSDTSVIDLFEYDCIGKCRPYYGGGPRFRVISPHIGGAPDIVNSLYAINKAVFEDRFVTWKDLRNAVLSNWEGNEPLRRQMLNRYTYYGNDNDEVDEMMVRLLNDFADCVADFRDPRFFYVPGVSTFGRQIAWAESRTATPFGMKKGDILSGNTSATPGTDTEGATALIRSYCKGNMERMTTGAALDVKILPQNLKGETGVEVLSALIRSFAALGGYFMQIDTVSVETLRDAQKHPENYKTLSVRISGWNARFVTLNEDWQNMVIEQTAHGKA